MTETTSKEEISPDDLLADFRGKSVFSIVLFTIFIHAVLFLGTSATYLWKTFGGAEASTLTEDQRIDNAMREATASLRKIAEENGIKPQELSNQIAKGKTTPSSETPSAEPEVVVEKEPEPEKPKSAIEQELEVKAKGPSLPSIPGDGEEDLFK